MNESRDREAGVQIVRKKLADGTTKEYRYARGRPSRNTGLGRFPPGSVGALIASYKTSMEWKSLRPATQSNYSIFLGWLDTLAMVPLVDLRRRKIVEIRDIVLSSSGPGSASAFVRVVSALMGWAVEREWIEYNPATKIRTPKGGTLRAWGILDVHEGLEKLEEPLRRVILVGMYTGQRRSDLCALRWSAYDGTTIRLTQKKTGAQLAIPVHPDLKRDLDEWKQSASSLHILTSATGRPWHPPSLTSRMLTERKKAGLPPNLNIHGLRKLAATLLAEAGCSTHEVAAITGHKTLAMVQHYTASANQERLAEAAIKRLKTDPVNQKKTA